MNRKKTLRLLGFGALLALTAGCSTTDTVESRIRKNPELFAGLSAEEKKQIQDGVITVGFSPEMVQMALGKPERIAPGRGPGEEDWIYVNVYSRDGNSLAMPGKVTMNFQKLGESTLHPIKFTDQEAMHRIPYYQLEPDLANEQIKAESAIKVHVKFTEGTVSDIQIVSDNKG